MLSIAKLRVGQEVYQLSGVAQSLDDYYTGRGEADGQWMGAGAERLCLCGEPRPSELETQMAIADVECKQSTDFVPAATDLLILHETEIADRIGLAELDTELREMSQSSGAS